MEITWLPVRVNKIIKAGIKVDDQRDELLITVNNNFYKGSSTATRVYGNVYATDFEWFGYPSSNIVNIEMFEDTMKKNVINKDCRHGLNNNALLLVGVSLGIIYILTTVRND